MATFFLWVLIFFLLVLGFVIANATTILIIGIVFCLMFIATDRDKRTRW